MKPYSQTRALLAIAKGSFRAMLRSPSAIVFNLVFPLVFIVVFGFINGGGIRVDVAVPAGIDFNNPLLKALNANPNVAVKPLANTADSLQAVADLAKGRLDGILTLHTQAATQAGQPPLTLIDLRTSAAAPESGRLLRGFIDNFANEALLRQVGQMPKAFEVRQQVVQGRAYRTIDFILPGQLGFSLLTAGVFGTAFIFMNLRNQLVIKRFFATPVRRSNIVLGEALARLSYQMLGAVVILTVGHFLFHFTLAHGFVTFMELLTLSALGMVVFMGFGFIVSSVAKNESSVPPFANLITLPQFLLAGTFFGIESFPAWLQPISKALPLTYLNTALRKVAFEGLSLLDVWPEMLVLLGWGVVVYAIAVRVFKWES